jgi:hypothetical protein
MESSDFLEKVASYVEGQISFEELLAWYEPRSFDLVMNPFSPDAELAASVEMCCASLADGDWTELDCTEHLRSRLAALPAHSSSDIYLDVTYCLDLPTTGSRSLIRTVTIGDAFADAERIPVYSIEL